MSYQGGSYHQQPRSASGSGSQYGQQQQQTHTSSSNNLSGDQETSTITTTTTTSYLAGYQQQAAQAQAQVQQQQQAYQQQITQGFQPQYQQQVIQLPQLQPAPQQQIVYQQQPRQLAQQTQYSSVRQASVPTPEPPPPPKSKPNYDHLKTKAPRPEPKAKPFVATTTTTTKKQEAVQTTGGTAQAAAEQRGEGQQFHQCVVQMIASLSICPQGFNWFPTAKGWICGGGNHGIKHEEIDRWVKNNSYQPKWVCVNMFDPYETNAQGYPVSRLWCPPDLGIPGVVPGMQIAHMVHIREMIAAGRGMKMENQCECAKAAGVLTKDQENELTAQVRQSRGAMNSFFGGMGGSGF